MPRYSHGALFTGHHYAVSYTNDYPPYSRVDLYEREKDAIKAARFLLNNTRRVTVYRITDGYFSGVTIMESQKKSRMVRVVDPKPIGG